MTVDPIESQRQDSLDNPVDNRCRERDEIRETIHEGDMFAIRGHIHGIASQQRPLAICPLWPQEDSRAFEMAATPAQRETFFQFKRLPVPEFDDGIGSLNPLPMVSMQVDWRVAERAAPLNHA